MYDDQKPLTSVNVTGVAEADYDTAFFSIAIEGRAKTGAAAKDKARPVIDQVNACLASLEKEGIGFAKDKAKAEFEVAADMEYDGRRQKPVGYVATYTLRVSTECVDQASKIHDKLSSVEGAQVASPSFKVKDLEALHKEALKDAKAKADKRFTDECEILGIDQAECTLQSYQTRYDESESAGARPMRAQLALMSDSYESAGGGGPPPVEIKAGKAIIKVQLTCTYIC